MTTAMDGPSFERAADIVKVMGHPLRLRLLVAMHGGEQSVGALVASTGAPQPVVSQQLATLRAHGIVGARVAGARHYYRIVEPSASRVLSCVTAAAAADIDA